ncbi:hypothetical protein Taro_017061 [Colocasia esculenta]|uniref:Uncharacterized protein n=1 Tax=Colocasia esculenta TaxID=4460 RepID=A0A843US41_COLES|nr:hypothetical protein [Colocasia esculenta]
MQQTLGTPSPRQRSSQNTGATTRDQSLKTQHPHPRPPQGVTTGDTEQPREKERLTQARPPRTST